MNIYHTQLKLGYPDEITSAIQCARECVSGANSCMVNNVLHVNYDKTEIVFVAPKSVSKSLFLPKSMNVNTDPITFSRALRNLR